MNKDLYLINKIYNRLSSVKPFIQLRSLNDDYHSIKMISNQKEITYHKSSINVMINKLYKDIDNYQLITYILDQIILSLTSNVKTKNFYFIDETIHEDIFYVLNNEKYSDVEWYVSMDTHINSSELVKGFQLDDDWTNLTINGKKINVLESSFPKDIIFGSKYSIIIPSNIDLFNTKILKEIEETQILTIPYYYIDDFYAIRLINDEYKKRMYLRNRKLNRIKRL